MTLYVFYLFCGICPCIDFDGRICPSVKLTSPWSLLCPSPIIRSHATLTFATRLDGDAAAMEGSDEPSVAAPAHELAARALGLAAPDVGELAALEARWP